MDRLSPFEEAQWANFAFREEALTRDAYKKARRVQRDAQRRGQDPTLIEALLAKNLMPQSEVLRLIDAYHERSGGWRGKVIADDYEIRSLIGSGASGLVFKARQLSFNRDIALKILAPKLARNAANRERFLREARYVARLSHPNIVSGVDVGESGGHSYFAMEFVNGVPVSEMLKKAGGPLPERDALRIVRQAADALSYLHQRGLLHRDVKPGNLLVMPDGTLKLVDFSLARHNERDWKPLEGIEAADAGPAITKDGKTVGTPYYMSPEQVEGRRLTPATDLYALGATLFQLLTGRVPFEGESSQDAMRMHLEAPVPEPRSANPRLSPAAADLCKRLLHKDPNKRPAAVTMIADLDRVLKDAAKPDTPKVPVAGKASGSKSRIIPGTRASGTWQVSRKPKTSALPVAGMLAGAVVLLVLLIAALGAPSASGERQTANAGRSAGAELTPGEVDATVQAHLERRRQAAAAAEQTAARKNAPAAVSNESALPGYLQPVADARGQGQAARPYMPRTAPAAPAETKTVPAPSLWPALKPHLAAGSYGKVREQLDAAPNAADAAFLRHCADVLQAFDGAIRVYVESGRVRPIRLGEFEGRVTNVREDGFSFQIQAGVERRLRWDKLGFADRLAAWKRLADEGHGPLATGIVNYFHGSRDEAARQLLAAPADGGLALPGGLRDELQAALLDAALEAARPDWEKLQAQAKDKPENAAAAIQAFAKAHPDAAAHRKDEMDALARDAEVAVHRKALAESAQAAAASNPVQPERPAAESKKPPASKAWDPRECLRGAVMDWQPGSALLELAYDFKSAAQLEDFVLGKDGAWSVQGGQGLAGGQAPLAHAVRWRDDRPLRLEVELAFEREGGPVGLGFVPRPEASAEQFILMRLGGVKTAGGARNRGAGIEVSSAPGESPRRPAWTYEKGNTYRLVLERSDRYWIGFVDQWKDRRLRAGLGDRWPAYLAVVAQDAEVCIKSLKISGCVDEDWISNRGR